MESKGYTLYTFPNNTRAWKGLIAAKYAGIEVNVPAFELGKDNKTPEFAAKNPLKKVPVLDTPEGPIFESNAIARYFARQEGSKLYGTNKYETALIDQWVDFCSGEIDLPAAAWLYPILGFVPENREATNKAKGDLRNVLNLLNKHLESRTFLVGERLTLADIAVSMSLLRLYTMVLDPGFRKGWTHLNRWFLTCVHQPNFIAVIGEVKLTEKMLVAKPAPKKEAPKPKAKKETPKPKPAPKKKEEGEEEPKPKKQPSALELLPKSSLDLEEWKRVYSNEDTRKVALPWLWEHMDYEGYSFWISDYKYNEDNKKMFMTLNLVGGFLQRLDRLRKYGFGSILIFGEEPKLEIAGVWLIRGSTLPKELTECDDSECYDWKKLNPRENEADKKLIEDYFAWDGDFGGNRPVFNEKAKVFK